ASTGMELAPYRAYDAETGRWISRDPLGEIAGLNLFNYVGNNPVTFTDPTGLEQLCLFSAAEMETTIRVKLFMNGRPIWVTRIQAEGAKAFYELEYGYGTFIDRALGAALRREAELGSAGVTTVGTAAGAGSI